MPTRAIPNPSTDVSSNQEGPLLTFQLGEQTYGLSLASVERVVRMAEISPLPDAPPIVHGVIDFHGRILPVFNLRRRFGLSEREPAIGDQLIVAHTARRTVILAVESVRGIVPRAPQRETPAGGILPRLSYVEGIAALQDGMIFIHDLNTFLSLDEEEALERALTPA